jgi:hypothetical protein
MMQNAVAVFPDSSDDKDKIPLPQRRHLCNAMLLLPILNNQLDLGLHAEAINEEIHHLLPRQIIGSGEGDIHKSEHLPRQIIGTGELDNHKS